MSNSKFSEAEIAQRRLIIEQLSLEYLHEFLMQPKPQGLEWTYEQTIVAETWYRRFLILLLMFPDHNLIPHPAIDRVWHGHIAVDTRQYARDCEAIFGELMHHDPSDEHEMPKDQVDFWYERTQKHFRTVFGEDYSELAWAEKPTQT